MQAQKKADRIGFRISDDNKKIRYYKSTGEPVTSK